MPMAAVKGGLAQFQELLIGTWQNQPIDAKGPGGQDNPLSYNVMPLPQSQPQAGQNNGFILKNFSYYETVQFLGTSDVAIPASAANRGSNLLQLPTALFYNQLVFFAEGPKAGQVVHVENGAWLNIQTGAPIVGPYGTPVNAPIMLNHPNQQPAALVIAKQVSVPHGNSVLALGSFDGPTAGAPVIPDAASTLPTPVISGPALSSEPYTTQLNQTDNYQNPTPALTANPNRAIQKAVSLIRPNMYIHWAVSTENKGATMDIPFEQRQADVTAYQAAYWLLSRDNGATYPYLVYSQNITMQIPINGTRYNFPHVTCNFVTKLPS